MRTHQYPATREQIDENGWTEVTRERYHALLGAVPPVRHAAIAFAVGEPLCQLDQDYRDPNKTVYDCLVQVGDRYFSKPNTLDRFDPPAFAREARAQHGIV